MKKYLNSAIIMALLAGSFLAGSWYSRTDPATNAASAGRQVLYYVDPMNPSHTSDQPGLAPCGMKMEPVYADGGPAGQAPGSIALMPPGTVKISPEKQQVIGVRVDIVEKSPGAFTVRTFGKVEVEENRIYRLVAATEGWVRELRDGTTGSLVQKDEILATFYSRDMLSGQQTLFFALSTEDRYKAANAPEDQVIAAGQQIRAAEANLMTLGMSETQIKELKHSRKPAREIEIRAPVTGFVQSRNVFPNLRFERNAELYRIVDLSRVWVLVDLFENEASYPQPGSEARVTLPYARKMFYGKVSETLPQFDAATRALKVRLEMDNPDFALRPDMFVDVEFPVSLPAAVTVPVDAVVDSGLRKTVFVDLGNGFFEPRRVETGWRLDGRVEVTGGLMPGERIVVSGNFLMDSESRMRLAAAGKYGPPSRDPVCGMDVDEGKTRAAGWQSEYLGKTYYFCSEQCKSEFENAPERFAGAPPLQAQEGYADHGAGHAHQMSSDAAPAEAMPAMSADEAEVAMADAQAEQPEKALDSGEQAPDAKKTAPKRFRRGHRHLHGSAAGEGKDHD